MTKASRFFAATAFILGVAATTTASAHGIWFAQRAKQLALIYGIGADDLDAVKRLPLVKSIAGYDAGWKPVATKLRVAGPLVLVDTESPTTAVAAVLDNGTWSKTPDGEWVKQGKDEVPNAVKSEHTFKYAVHLTGPMTTPLPALTGQTLQIVPIDAALPAEKDKPLKLRVLLNGKPASGARVLTDMVNDPDSTPLKTAADGSVTINVRNQGLNVVTAILDGPSDQPTKYDKIEHLATLSFVLPHAPE